MSRKIFLVLAGLAGIVCSASDGACKCVTTSAPMACNYQTMMIGNEQFSNCADDGSMCWYPSTNWPGYEECYLCNNKSEFISMKGGSGKYTP